MAEDEFHASQINVLGVLLGSREALKYFGPDGGSVINISSIASRNPMPTAVLYSPTNGALDTATRVLAKELAPQKIRVDGIIGGDFEKDMVARTPLGRLGQPIHIRVPCAFRAAKRW